MFSFIRSKFSEQINPISALVITGFEGEDNDKRNDFIRKFESQSYTAEIASQMNKGIIPVGFPPVRRLDHGLQQAYEQPMQDDKERLLNLIASCEHACAVERKTLSEKHAFNMLHTVMNTFLCNNLNALHVWHAQSTLKEAIGCVSDLDFRPLHTAKDD